MTEIICSIGGYLTQEHIEPLEWDVSDTESAKVRNITEITLKPLFQDGVNIEDEEVVRVYVRSHEFEILSELIVSEYPALGKEIERDEKYTRI